jgi:hypothetical protein
LTTLHKEQSRRVAQGHFNRGGKWGKRDTVEGKGGGGKGKALPEKGSAATSVDESDERQREADPSRERERERKRKMRGERAQGLTERRDRK